MNRHLIFYFLIGVIFFASCTGGTTRKIDQSFLAENQRWKQQRLRELRQPDGWPTLVGLYWLEEGKNTIGSEKQNDIRFPKPLPDRIGEIELIENEVRYRNVPNIGILHEGKKAEKGILRTDLQENTTYLYWNAFQWHVIHRGEKYGIRLKDTLHPARMILKEIPSYPVQSSWNKMAKFSKADENTIVSIDNQVNMTIPYKIEGYLTFKHKGVKRKLIALDGGPRVLFVLISDKTTGLETYGGGRYLYVPRPDENGITFIDFNRAVNPPCIFTDFATCLLPPKENALPFRVLAGEKMYGEH
jgi:uncharacterized protein (DUF1684 family)